MRRAKPPPVRLLVVDDHEIVRKGLRSVLGHADGIEVVGEAAGVAEAISEAIRLTPDVVLMDVRLQDGTGVEACREILAARPATRVLFLTSFSDEEAVLAAVFAGASGYLLKEIGAEALLSAIASVAAGHSILDPVAVRAMTEKMNAMAGRGAESEGDALSPQERRVLALVARGKTNKEIGAALGLSDKTVKNYLSNIFQKLRVTRRSQAAAIYTSKLR
jgi:two-component system, NarL family, response regulator DevR